MTFKSDLNHFQAPTIDNDLGRLSEKQIGDQQKFTRRANAAYAWVKKNGFPAGYEESAAIYNEIAKRQNAGPVNLEDVYALDQATSQTVWDNDTFSKLPIPTYVMSKPRWDMKDYLVQSDDWPRFTTQFRNPIFFRMKESSQFTNGIGIHAGISIPFTEIRESQGALWSPQAILMQELASKFGVVKSRRGFLGTSCQTPMGDDGSDASLYAITGLYNYGSAQTFEAGAGADDNIADQGDLEYSIRVGLADLRKVYQPGAICVVSSSAAAAQMYHERDTYQQKLDVERVKEMLSTITNNMSPGTTWGGWWVTDQLYASAPATGYDQICVFKAGPGLMARHIVYPQQTLAMANKMYEADIQENMIFGDIFQVKKIDSTNNAVPITKAADLTSDNINWIPEGTRIF